MYRSVGPRPRYIVLALSMVFVLSLTGCQTAGTQDAKSASVTVTAPTKESTRAAATLTSGKRVKNTPGDFDFYVLALSWSPDYCAGSNGDDPQQCSLGKKLGFVLHGLWPQYTRGYPADCSSVKLPKDAQQKFPNLYPSPQLYAHEWDKHGTCSGLKPAEFLMLSKTLKDSIAIPPAYRSPAKAFRTTADDLKAAFVATNSTLSEDALAVQCSGSGRFLKELYACFSRDGQLTACSTEIQKDAVNNCRNADFLVRNVK